MICVAALIVFAFLALFSAKYRPLAKEAFSCVFLKLRLRPCQSGLDRRVRMAATMPFVKRTPKLAKFVYSSFPVLSAIFVILTVASAAYVAYGGYNYLLYGNCNGPGSSGFCVFDPNGAGESLVSEKCTDHPNTPEALIIPTEAELAGFKTFHAEQTKTVVFFGCYSCEYTRKAAPALFAVMDKRPDVRFVLIDFPLPRHAGSTLAANAANCVFDQDPALYRSYAQALFAANLSQGLPDPSTISNSIDPSALALCANTTHSRVAQGTELGKDIGLYGTPTYFINGKAYVGPLNERALNKLIG